MTKKASVQQGDAEAVSIFRPHHRRWTP